MQRQSLLRSLVSVVYLPFLLAPLSVCSLVSVAALLNGVPSGETSGASN